MAVYLRHQPISDPSSVTAVEGKFISTDSLPMTLPKAVEEKSLLVRRLSATPQDDELGRVSICAGRQSVQMPRVEVERLEMLNSPALTLGHAQAPTFNTDMFNMQDKRYSVQAGEPADPAHPEGANDSSSAPDAPPSRFAPSPASQAIPDSLQVPSSAMPPAAPRHHGSKRISYLADEVKNTENA